VTNERTESSGWRPTYSWLPQGVELWSRPENGGSDTVLRVLAIQPLIWSQVAFGPARAVWGLAASGVVVALALLAWPLRRRSVRPGESGAWVETAKSAVRLIRPAKGPGPAVVTEVRAEGGTALDPQRSAASIRAARRLLTAAGAADTRLQLVGYLNPPADLDEDDDDKPPSDVCVVLHDADAAFVLELEALPDEDDEEQDEDEDLPRQRAVLGRAATALGAEPPAVPGRGGRIPEELLLTAEDLRTFADAGIASAQRLEREFAGQTTDGPADIALELGRIRAWPSRVDRMTVRQLAAADPAKIAPILMDDLAAQAAADRAREQRDKAAGAPVTDEWELRWHLYLERYAARPAAGTDPADIPPDGPRTLTAAARAALLLAVTATDACGGPLRPAAARAFGLAAEPAVRRVPWPRYRAAARAGDRILLVLTVALPSIPFTHLW
jgi:hypothetical protein